MPKQVSKLKKPTLKKSILMIVIGFSIAFPANTAQAASKKVEYTCNEGIPLIVEFINTNASSIAIISHDSSPRIALDNVVSGSGAKYTDGNWVLHVKGKTALVGTQGQFDDECKEVETAAHTPHSDETVKLPRKAKSWGGIVRSGPGMNYRKKASLREGEWITILERTDQYMNDYPWFKIKYRGRIGYKWGGILCSVGQQIEGTYQTCN